MAVIHYFPNEVRNHPLKGVVVRSNPAFLRVLQKCDFFDHDLRKEIFCRLD